MPIGCQKAFLYFKNRKTSPFLAIKEGRLATLFMEVPLPPPLSPLQKFRLQQDAKQVFKKSKMSPLFFFLVWHQGVPVGNTARARVALSLSLCPEGERGGGPTGKEGKRREESKQAKHS